MAVKTSLDGDSVKMYDAETHEELETFTSQNKAGKFAGYVSGNAFSYTLHRKRKVEVIWKYKKRIVYFKLV